MEDKLFNHFMMKGMLNDFTDNQVEKFRFSCKKAVLENPQLDFNDLLKACRIYLGFIRDFPECDLGDIVTSAQP